MDAFVFVALLAVSVGAFWGGYRAVVDRPPFAVLFGVLSVLASTVLLAAVVSDPAGVTWTTTETGSYVYTLAAELGGGDPEPEFSFPFDTQAGLSGWFQSRNVSPVSGGTLISWSTEHGGSLALTVPPTTSTSARFAGLYWSGERPAGHEWDTLSFDYRLVGTPGRHGLEVAWTCTSCLVSNETSVVTLADATSDTGWQHVDLTIPISEKDIEVIFRQPYFRLTLSPGEQYPARTIYLDNVELTTAGLTVTGSSGTSTTSEHGETSAGRWVLTSDTTVTETTLVEATAANRQVVGGLLGAWSLIAMLATFGGLAPILGGAKRR